MSSINFFTPVVYNNQMKTKPQQALEAVGECLYLGNAPRVTIFAPDAKHPQSWALQNRQGRYRSWMNITMKIIACCIAILPLFIFNAALRRHLKVGSIKVQQQLFAPNSVEVKLPVNVLQKINSFLSHKDQDELAPVAYFTFDAARKTQQLTASLKTEIEALPRGPIARDDFQRLLVKLVTSPASPAAGHYSKHWVSVMNALMTHEIYVGRNIIQANAHMADLLATSEETISPDQIYQFCKYLGCNQISQFPPWAGYRALEQYHLLKPQFTLAVNKYLKEYLTQKAKTLIVAIDNGFIFPKKLSFQKINIDPREWFGSGKYALWHQTPDTPDGEIAPSARMPELLLEALWTRIQSLYIACTGLGQPFEVSMIGRIESQLPKNFTLQLAKRITNAGMFLEHNDTIDEQELEKPYYARSLYLQDFEKLVEEYPKAVKS